MNTANVDHQRVAFSLASPDRTDKSDSLECSKSPCITPAIPTRYHTLTAKSRRLPVRISFNDGLPITATDAYATMPAAVAKTYHSASEFNKSRTHKKIAGLAQVIQNSLGTLRSLWSSHAAIPRAQNRTIRRVQDMTSPESMKLGWRQSP